MAAEDTNPASPNHESPAPTESKRQDRTHGDLEALQQIIKALGGVTPERRLQVVQSAMTFFGINEGAIRGAFSENPISYSTTQPRHSPPQADPSRPLDFSTRENISAKEFMKEKHPQTDVERVACLAFYLTHYRDTPHFKTLELSKVNTEAAQPKFTNAAYATNNALNSGYLAPAPKGMKQLSAAGEQFVQLLPDREAAKAAMTTVRTRRKSRKNGNRDTKKGDQ